MRIELKGWITVMVFEMMDWFFGCLNKTLASFRLTENAIQARG
tara:strand:+ start:1364 stop:1492 length:129 start_codon:yes stop_codon:yes gene_type:complete